MRVRRAQARLCGRDARAPRASPNGARHAVDSRFRGNDGVESGNGGVENGNGGEEIRNGGAVEIANGGAESENDGEEIRNEGAIIFHINPTPTPANH